MSDESVFVTKTYIHSCTCMPSDIISTMRSNARSFHIMKPEGEFRFRPCGHEQQIGNRSRSIVNGSQRCRVDTAIVPPYDIPIQPFLFPYYIHRSLCSSCTLSMTTSTTISGLVNPKHHCESNPRWWITVWMWDKLDVGFWLWSQIDRWDPWLTQCLCFTANVFSATLSMSIYILQWHHGLDASIGFKTNVTHCIQNQYFRMYGKLHSAILLEFRNSAWAVMLLFTHWVYRVEILSSRQQLPEWRRFTYRDITDRTGDSLGQNSKLAMKICLFFLHSLKKSMFCKWQEARWHNSTLMLFWWDHIKPDDISTCNEEVDEESVAVCLWSGFLRKNYLGVLYSPSNKKTKP